MSVYDRAFYQDQSDGSYRSARIILQELRAILPFDSACDVGCGAGTWVRALGEMGVGDAIGVDGDYARPSLQIPPERFVPRDLRSTLSLDRRFDLALSLEVAEHLPPERSAGFVEDLTRIAPAVLFSAAIPWQGGTAHINERWQTFWVSAFAERGFECHDVIRPRVWDDRRVEVWYRQNTLLFLAADHPARDAVRMAAREALLPASVVHPEMFPLGFNMDNKMLLLRLFYWSLARDMQRLLGRRRRGGAQGA